MEGWIKLHRKLLNWEWYKTGNMVHLFTHLLLSANHETGKWQGIDIKRGQLITGRNSLSKETGISSQSIRTCLQRLKSTNELTIKSTNKYSIITILKYEDYQIKINDNNQQINQLSNKQLTNNQPATNQQLTTNKNNKEVKNEKNEKKEYAEFVKLTSDEYSKLLIQHGEQNTNTLIQILNNYKGSNGKKYKSDYLTILNWVIDRAKKDGKYIEKTKLAI